MADTPMTIPVMQQIAAGCIFVGLAGLVPPATVLLYMAAGYALVKHAKVL